MLKPKVSIRHIPQLIGYAIGGSIVVAFLWFFFKPIIWDMPINMFSTKPWIGSYYKEQGDPDTILDSKKFDSLEDCETWGQGRGEYYGTEEYPNWDYVCGYNCEFTDKDMIGGVDVHSYACERVVTRAGDSASYVDYFSEQAEQIRMIYPQKNDIATNPLYVEGQVPGSWSSEGVFPIEIVDENDDVIATGQGVLNGDWMTDELVPFSATIEYTQPEFSDIGNVILRKANPSGLEENEDRLEIPVYWP